MAVPQAYRTKLAAPPPVHLPLEERDERAQLYLQAFMSRATPRVREYMEKMDLEKIGMLMAGFAELEILKTMEGMSDFDNTQVVGRKFRDE